MERTWLLRAATLLDDPIMMDWALLYYEGLPPRSELRERLATLWFHDFNLKRWIDGDDRATLGLALHCLPEHCFANFGSAIAAGWSEWPSTLVNSAARILAGVEPGLAAQTFGQYLKQTLPLSTERVISILANLEKLPLPAALQIFEKLMPLTQGNGGLSRPYIQQHAFGAAVQLNETHDLPRLLDGLLSGRDHQLQGVVESVAVDLFGHDSYTNLFFLRREGRYATSFNDLAALFNSDAPLSEMDAVLLSETPLPVAMMLLETHHDRSFESRLTWEMTRQSKTCREKTHPLQLAALALTAVAAAFERKTIDAARLSIDRLLAFLAMDVKVNIHYDPLINILRGLPKEEVVAATVIHQGKVNDTFGGVTLARAMGDLCWAEFVEPLIDCLNETSGDFLCEAAQNSLLSIGEPARDALIAKWDELDSSQKIYGSSVITRVGGAPVAEFTLSRSDDLLHDSLEQWCSFILAAPDYRLIEHIRPELRRNQDPINETCYRLYRLLDVDSPELAELRTNIMGRRAQQQKQMEHCASDDIFEQRITLNLSLRCGFCNDVNHYEVRHVVVGDAASQKPYLIADEFPCLSCGEFADFEFEPEAKLALIAEAMLLQSAAESGKKQSSHLISAGSASYSDGTMQSIPAAYAVLQKKVLDNPGDWLSWFRLSNINHQINRPKAALSCLRKAYAINPLSLETIINLASILSEAGHSGEALNILNNALKSSTQWQTLSSRPDEKGSEFAQLFNHLRRQTGRRDLPALHPGFFKQAAKTGRNDPCPCGSGRKFKKCCGADRTPSSLH